MNSEVNGIESADAMNAALRVDGLVVEKLRNTTVLITGGTGFLGSWIVEALRGLNEHKGTNIRILLTTRNEAAATRKFPHWSTDTHIEIVQHDVCLPFEWNVGSVDYMIHGATDVERSCDSQWALARSICQGTNNILELAQLCKPISLMYLSSGSSAPSPAGVVLTDELNTSAPSTTDCSGYASSKRFSEFLVNLASKEIGFTPVITRGFSFVGPRMPLEKFAIGNFLREAAKNCPPKLNSNGNALRSYLYAGDAAVWYLTMLTRGVGTYNVGSEDARTILEMASTVSRLANVADPVIVNATPEETRTSYAPATSRARTELGLRVFTDTETALMRTLNWIQSMSSASMSNHAPLNRAYA